MKAKIVCFKLSKTIYILAAIVLLQLGFIVFQIKELLEVRKFYTNTRKYRENRRYR